MRSNNKSRQDNRNCGLFVQCGRRAFNDLIRKGNKDAKLIVVDPDSEGAAHRVCQTVGHDKVRLRSTRLAGLECKVDGRLTLVKAKAEEITATQLTALLRN